MLVNKFCKFKKMCGVALGKSLLVGVLAACSFSFSTGCAMGGDDNARGETNMKKNAVTTEDNVFERTLINPEGGDDFNFSSMPNPVRGIKFDPFVGDNDFYGEDQTDTVARKVSFWKSIGFNMIYTIVRFGDGQQLYPSDDANPPYDSGKFGPDFLGELAKESKKQGLALAAGNWMFRDSTEYDAHPDWRQVNAIGMPEKENLVCPNSPYLETKFYPFYNEAEKCPPLLQVAGSVLVFRR